MCFVTARFCDLGCITPSEVDDLQILRNSMLVKGFSSIIGAQTCSTGVCQTRTSDATLEFILQSTSALFQVLVAGWIKKSSCSICNLGDLENSAGQDLEKPDLTTKLALLGPAGQLHVV